jgi:hypothetical protein
MGHVLMENRNGLAVAGTVTQATGIAEREASAVMLAAKAKEAGQRITVGADKAYDSTEHVAALRAANVTPHAARHDYVTKTGGRRRSAIDGRTTRHEGYGLSQICRKMAECIFGWASSMRPCAKPNIEVSIVWPAIPSSTSSPTI